MKVDYWYMLLGTIDLSKDEIHEINELYNGDVESYLCENYNMYEHAHDGEMKEIQFDKKELVNLLLCEEIEKHNKGKCRCDLTEGGYGLCYAAQWLEGIVTSEQVLKDYEYIK